MHAFRALLIRHRMAAAAIVALALAMRLLVPTGFMPTMQHDRLVISLCSGSGPAMVSMEMGKHHGDASHGSTADTVCPFAGLAAPALGNADPVLLAIAIAFAMLLAARAIVPLATVPLRLRPPLRGPPATT